MSLMPVASEPEGTLFELAPFHADQFAVAFRSASNVAITEDVARKLETLVGTERLFKCDVYVTVKGYKREYNKLVFDLVVGDATVEA